MLKIEMQRIHVNSQAPVDEQPASLPHRASCSLTGAQVLHLQACIAKNGTQKKRIHSIIHLIIVQKASRLSYPYFHEEASTESFKRLRFVLSSSG